MAGGSTVRGSAATYNRPRGDRVIVVYFHTDRYRGKCKLKRIPQKSGQKPLEYQSEPIQEVIPKRKWAAAFRQTGIPPGKYLLEVPIQTRERSDLKSIYHFVTVDHAYRNVLGITGSGDSIKVKSPRTTKPVYFEPLIGDGYSLEEAFLRFFSYKYDDGMIATLKALTPREEQSKEAKAYDDRFTTFVRVTKAIHDRVAATAGWIRMDNEYFETFDKLKEIYKESSWAKAKEAMESLNVKEDLETSARRFGRKEWQEALDEKAKGVLKPIDWVGKALSVYSHVSAFDEVVTSHLGTDKAESRFYKHATSFHESRKKAAAALSKELEACFARGELIELESLCQAADNLAGDALVAGTGFVYDMLGLGIGLLFPEGFAVSLLGKGAGTALNVLDVVATGLGWVDELAFDSELSNRWRDIKEWWHDTGAVCHNNNWAFAMRLARTRSSWSMHEYMLQFLYRAKVLYGLMDLIDQCGPYERSKSVFQRRVKELRIREYLDRFVFGGPFWVRNDHLGADWVDRFHLDTDAETRDQVVRFSGQKKDGSDHAGWNQYGPHGWTKIDFQRWFPIHFMDHDNAFEFARDLSVDYSGIQESHLATTFWQVASKVSYVTSRESGGNYPVNLRVDRWRTLKKGDVIDSETPVRAVMVLKKNAPVRSGVPVTFQLYRVDWANVSGPTYRGAIRRLRVEDGLPRKHTDATSGKTVRVRGRKGAIVEFDYHYTWKDHEPSTVYSGLKPLKGWCHSTIVQPMKMSVWWTIGRNEGQDWLANGQEIELIWQNRGVVPKDENWSDRNFDKFRDLDFLVRSSASEKHACPVDKEDVDLILQTSQDSEKWERIGIQDRLKFGQRIRVVIRVKKRGHMNPGIPATVQVVRTDGTNAEGPVYRSEQMVDLRQYGLKGWGTVIELWYYILDNTGLKVDAKTGRRMAEIQKFWGVKPVHYDPYQDYARVSFRGFTFDLLCTVGDSWKRPMRAKPDDIPYEIHDTIAGDILAGFRTEGKFHRGYYVFHDKGAKVKALVVGGTADGARQILEKAVSLDLADPRLLIDE